MCIMDNYHIMRQAAQTRFCTYDAHALAQKRGVIEESTCLSTVFLGEKVEIDKRSGICTFPGTGCQADFCETLTVLDWLCDSQDNAQASYRFCPVTNLTRAYTSGGGLSMNGDFLAAAIEKDPEAFCKACRTMGGREVPIGDLGFELDAFPGLPLRLKFYHSDEEFPPSLTFLWDENTLSFIRYETVYYLAGSLRRRLEAQMENAYLNRI